MSDVRVESVSQCLGVRGRREEQGPIRAGRGGAGSGAEDRPTPLSTYSKAIFEPVISTTCGITRPALPASAVAYRRWSSVVRLFIPRFAAKGPHRRADNEDAQRNELKYEHELEQAHRRPPLQHAALVPLALRIPTHGLAVSTWPVAKA